METRPRLVVVGVMLSIVLAAMESTVVATAMPTVVGALGGIKIYSWVFSAFLLTSTVTMPLWGRLSDLFGRRPAYLLGLTIFGVSSVGAAFATSTAGLVVARGCMGIGGACTMPSTLSVLGNIFPEHERGKCEAA